MSPRTIGEVAAHEVEPLRLEQHVREAARAVVASGFPALPVVGPDGRYVGIFGEREFMTALFPGYLGTLSSARFIPRSLEEMLEKRSGALEEPVERYMNTEHISVHEAWSDVEVAETFLHHRVLIIPVIDDRGHLVGIITRGDFFRGLTEFFCAT